MNMLGQSRYMQYLASITAAICSLIVGILTSWPSPSIPILKSEKSNIERPITIEEGSWIVSLLQIGPLITLYPANYVIKNYGRKPSLLIAAIPNIISWIFIIFGKHIAFIYIARLLAGMGTTFSNAATSLYIAEIADKDIRGKLGTLFNLMKLFGSLLVLSSGPFLSYKVLAILCTCVPVIFLCIFVKMPESPYFLVKTKKIEKAKVILYKLGKAQQDENNIKEQLLDIEKIIEDDQNKNSNKIMVIFAKKYRKLLYILIGIKTIQQMSGSVAIDAYMQTIIEASNTQISMSLISILYAVIQIPSVIFVATKVDKLGRKPLYIFSCIGCAISLITEGLYFYLQDVLEKNLTNFSWLPTLALILFAVMNNLGIASLPYVLMGELFPMSLREIAMTFSILYGTILAFLVSKCFEPLSYLWGRYVVFWIFGLFCMLGAIFVYFFIPETKGKSFAEIQKKLGINEHM